MLRLKNVLGKRRPRHLAVVFLSIDPNNSARKLVLQRATAHAMH